MKSCKSKALASLPKWKDLLERTNGGEGLLDIVAMAVAIAAGDENVYLDLKERILKQGDKDPDTVPALLARLEAVADMRQSIKAQANFTGTDIYTEMAGKIADAVAKEHSLDFSLKSLEKVDSLLHGAKQRTEKEKKRLAESLGYYVGEVFIVDRENWTTTLSRIPGRIGPVFGGKHGSEAATDRGGLEGQGGVGGGAGGSDDG